MGLFGVMQMRAHTHPSVCRHTVNHHLLLYTHAPADGDEGPIGRGGGLDDAGAAVAGAGGDVGERQEGVEEGKVVHLRVGLVVDWVIGGFDFWRGVGDKNTWSWAGVRGTPKTKPKTNPPQHTHKERHKKDTKQQETPHRALPEVAGGVELVEEPAHLVALRLRQLRLRLAELVHLGLVGLGKEGERG